MSIFEHHRFEIWNQTQHPYKHDASEFGYTTGSLPGVTSFGAAMDWVINVLYPTPKASVADVTALNALAGNAIGDYRVVLDDGDGKSAGYRWEQREGDVAAKWYKIYDMDFGAGSVLQQAADNAQELFVLKWGNNDLDSTGVAVAGLYAGQVIYGGKTASTNLTLRANSGDGTGATTGNVQVDDNFRPAINNTYDLGSTSFRWKDLWVAGTSTLAGRVATSGGALSSQYLNRFGSTSTQTLLSGTVQGAVDTSIKITSAATAEAYGVTSRLSSDNSSFTTPFAYNFYVDSFVKGASHTLTRSIGFGGVVTTAATNNAFIADNVVFTGNWNIHLSTTNGSFVGGTFGAAGTSTSAILNGGSTSTSVLAGTTQYGVLGDNLASSAATSEAAGLSGRVRTTDAIYTTAFAAGVTALSAVKGTQNTITRLFGFFVNNPTVGANNASFGDNVAFTGSYFIHSNSTNPSVLGAGGLTIGSTTHSAGVGFRITSTSSGFFTGTGQIGILADPFFTSAATVDAYQVKAQVQTQNASFTLPIATAFYAATAAKGGSNTITRLINYLGDVQSAGTNNAWGSDNTAFTGSFVFNFTSTNPAFFTGASAQARADVASASTITALSSTNGFVKLTGSTATSLQGITAGINGQRLTIVNLTAANLTVANENAGASAANRITTMTGADVATTANGTAEFIYDTGTSRWICLYVTT
jgi:hypothetical protein